jgi:hypothetical protein
MLHVVTARALHCSGLRTRATSRQRGQRGFRGSSRNKVLHHRATEAVLRLPERISHARSDRLLPRKRAKTS